MVGMEIQADSCLPRIRRPYKTKGFALRVSYIASLPLHLQLPSLSTEYRRQSTEGYPAMVDLSVGMRVIRNRMVTQGTETAI